MTKKKGRKEAVVKVACVQMEPAVGDKNSNVRRNFARAADEARTMKIVADAGIVIR